MLVKAAVHTINGFSAHAGREGLLEWLTGFKDSPRVFIVHGEDEAAASFAGLVKEELGFNVTRPRDGEVYDL